MKILALPKGAESTVSEELFDWMLTIRRYLHRHPEISFKEDKSARYIQDRLSELGIPFRAGIAGTGIVATLGEKTAATRHVALRADMDALPITEKTGLPFSSVYKGRMHACGHDGHSAMLLGAASLLQKMKFDGRIDFLFQPAEESGCGAAAMIDAGVLDGVDAVFGGHIDTHFPTGIITVDQGVICAWAEPFTISIQGRSGHAARPHEAADAVVASASLISALQTLVSRETNPNHSAVVSIGRVQAGVAHNVIADEAVLEGTLRATDSESRARTITGIQRIVAGIAALHDVEVSVVFTHSLPAVVNTGVATVTAKEAALSVVGEHGLGSQGHPSLGGEDFAFYQQVTEGCLVRFGAQHPDGAGPAHSATYDFDENVLPVGASWLAAVALRWLGDV